jgi:ABC-type sugar transport system, periplasmic component
MKKYLAIILSFTLIFSTLLTGCGKQDSNFNGENATTKDQASTDKPASNAKGEKKVLKAMFLGSTSEQAVVDIIKQVTDEFNKNNPYNVEFQFETYENEQYKTKLTTVMASNSAPDVFFTWSAGYLKPFVEGGKVYEIGQLLDKDQDWKNRFNDGVFGPVTYNGKIYAVPHGQTIAPMYYNTRLFEKYGVAVPKTYDDFVKACKTFKDNGIVPISVPVQDAWIAGQFLQQIGDGVGGMDLYNGTVDASRAWNDPDYVKAGTMLSDLVKMGAFQKGFLGMTNDEGRDLFTQEKAAMYFMGSWDISVLNQSKIAKYVNVFNLPASNLDTGNVALGDVDQCLAISANCAEPEAAAAYIKLFSDKAAQEAYAYKANYLLSTKTVLDESKLSPLYASVNNLQKKLTGVTPWLDRVFGAGEGAEFNNVAQAIMAGKDPKERFDGLQQYAKDNATH